MASVNIHGESSHSLVKPAWVKSGVSCWIAKALTNRLLKPAFPTSAVFDEQFDQVIDLACHD
jgi:hypothetical protein